MHGRVRLYRHKLISLHDNNHPCYLFIFFKNVFVFISFVKHFLNIIFVLKINIVFDFVSVNDSKNISVSVIVTVTEISLEHVRPN